MKLCANCNKNPRRKTHRYCMQCIRIMTNVTRDKLHKLADFYRPKEK